MTTTRRIWLFSCGVAGFATSCERVADAVAPGRAVVGAVRLSARPPPPREIVLDDVMRRATGETKYRDERYVVGVDLGLADCVVTLTSINPSAEAAPRPLENVVIDKIGVRYSPRVSVITPGTQVTLRNRSSPCRGFQFTGRNSPVPYPNYMIFEGQTRTIRFDRPDICTIGCVVRPYTRGHLLVVGTPFFAVTDANGRFAIRDVPAGSYKVRIWHESAAKPSAFEGPREMIVGSESSPPLEWRLAPQETTPAR